MSSGAPDAPGAGPEGPEPGRARGSPRERAAEGSPSARARRAAAARAEAASGGPPAPGAAGAAGALGRSARWIAHALGVGEAGPPRRRGPRRPGAAPGIDRAPDVDVPPPPGAVRIRVLDYAAERAERWEPADVHALLAAPRPPWATVRWVDVAGLHPYVIARLREALGFHTLAAEDTLHGGQRPKLEAYEDHLFVVTRMLRLRGDEVENEQVTIFLLPGLVLTFQEEEGDVWDPIRERLERPGSRMRAEGAAYLLYAQIDAIVDHAFPILERYGDRLEELELAMIESPGPAELRALHGIKRELVVLRRVLWPTRQLVDDLYRGEHELVDRATRPYLRDVYDHAVRVLEVVETYREIAGGLTDLYMSAVSNRMNEVMKVLTIMASIFVPITFLAGVYGMNFRHFPELDWKWSYPLFWAVCLGLVAGLLLWFRRKGWIGAR